MALARLVLERCRPEAVWPMRATPGSAGLDLCALLVTAEGMDLDLKGHRFSRPGPAHRVLLHPGGRVLLPTGWKAQVPSGTYLRIAPRSGLALKHGLDVLAGVIDADFTGEIGVVVVNTGHEGVMIEHGMRVAQMIQECIVMEDPVAGEISATSRGVGGYGSTGMGPGNAA